METQQGENVSSPCIGLCSTSLGDSVCRGCKRFCHEVSNWNAYEKRQKMAVERRLSSFQQRVVEDKIELLDAGKILVRLEKEGINYPRGRPPICLVWDVLRVIGGSIPNSEEYTKLLGFRVKPAYRNLSMVELRERISADFYELSVAYYQRHVGPLVKADWERIQEKWKKKGKMSRDFNWDGKEYY